LTKSLHISDMVRLENKAVRAFLLFYNDNKFNVILSPAAVYFLTVPLLLYSGFSLISSCLIFLNDITVD